MDRGNFRRVGRKNPTGGGPFTPAIESALAPVADAGAPEGTARARPDHPPRNPGRRPPLDPPSSGRRRPEDGGPSRSPAHCRAWNDRRGSPGAGTRSSRAPTARPGGARGRSITLTLPGLCCKLPGRSGHRDEREAQYVAGARRARQAPSRCPSSPRAPHRFAPSSSRSGLEGFRAGKRTDRGASAVSEPFTDEDFDNGLRTARAGSHASGRRRHTIR